MSLARGRFGIEYDPDGNRRDGASGLGWVVALVLLVVAVSLTVTVVRRVRHRAEEEKTVALPPDVETGSAGSDKAKDLPPPKPPAPKGFDEVFATLGARSGKVRALLMKLQEAQHLGRLQDEADAIAQLRDLPGNPALDLNDLLVKRLGDLNLSWLFDRHNPQWTRTVEVKSGDSASRIAQEYGSTLESFRRLNPDVNVDRLRVGEKVCVMDRPRFYLSVYRNTGKADLMLKGCLFKRYDLRAPLPKASGTFEPTGNLRKFLAEHDVWFNRTDRQELETLLPKKFTFVIGDL